MKKQWSMTDRAESAEELAEKIRAATDVPEGVREAMVSATAHVPMPEGSQIIVYTDGETSETGASRMSITVNTRLLPAGARPVTQVEIDEAQGQ